MKLPEGPKVQYLKESDTLPLPTTSADVEIFHLKKQNEQLKREIDILKGTIQYMKDIAKNGPR